MAECARVQAGDNVRGLFWYCKPCMLHWSEQYRGKDWRPAKCVMHRPVPTGMPPLTKAEACNIAAKLASAGPDELWNRLFIGHLCIHGYLVAVEPDDEPFMAPTPLGVGWAYPYPSYIVRDVGRD